MKCKNDSPPPRGGLSRDGWEGNPSASTQSAWRGCDANNCAPASQKFRMIWNPFLLVLSIAGFGVLQPSQPSPTSQHNPSLQHCNSCREKSPTFFGVLSSSCIHPHTKKKMRARSRVLASEVPFNTVRCGAGSSITNRSLTTQNSIAELNAGDDSPLRQRRPEARLRLVLGWQSCRIRTTRSWCQSAHSPR